MVTKSTSKKRKVFSKKYTMKRKYYGGVGEDEALSQPSLTGDLSSESPNIQIPSFVDETQHNKALASNTDTLIEQSLAMNENFYIIEKIKDQVKEKILELAKSQTPTTSGISGMSSEERKKQAELSNQRAIAMGLDNKSKKQTGIHSISEYIDTSGTGDQSNMVLNTPSSQRIPIKGGGSYNSFYELTDTGREKWKKLFFKFKELQSLFSTKNHSIEKRADSINRFFLYLEMMEFYNSVKYEINILKQMPGNIVGTYISSMYADLDEADKTKIADPEISSKIVNIIIPTNDYQSGEYFVKFILFNTSISNLFDMKDQRLVPFNINKKAPEFISLSPEKKLELEEDEKKYRTALVNIFQLSEKKTSKDFKELNTGLTDALPGVLVKAKMDSTDFYTQFKTFPLSLDYFNKTFFKKTAQTGDNVSALVRSTILYVISQLLNNEAFINALYSEEPEFIILNRVLKDNWRKREMVNSSFLTDIIGSFTTILFSGTMKGSIETLKHFLIASSDDVYKDSHQPTIHERSIDPTFGCAIPYNIFLNFFKRESDTIYLTTIPDNIITNDGLNFVNALESILTNSKYLNQITRKTIEDDITSRDYKNTNNTFDVEKKTDTSELTIIGLSKHENKNALSKQITDFEDFTEDLKFVKANTPSEGGITANVKKEIKTIHTNHVDFKKALTESSTTTFDSDNKVKPARIIPDNCKLKTHIDYLDGSANATIDCQRSCLMSQLVYENTKVVRQFDFKNCWGRDETLREGTIQVDDFQNPSVKKNITVKRGLKYLCAYQPNYQYGSYTNDMMSATSSIDRFNNSPYKVKGSDNKYLVNYNYVHHKCHVWIDDYLKRVYIVFRGTASTYDWYYTDVGIASGLGFQEGRLQQIKEILRDVYRQLNTYASTYQQGAEESVEEGVEQKQKIAREDSRQDYKVIFSGHSLGGFLAIMSSVAVYNNNKFDYKDTFKKATSITFNPWFPPEAVEDVEVAQKVAGIGIGTLAAAAGTAISTFATGGLALLGIGAAGGYYATGWGASKFIDVNQKQGFLNYYAPLINYGNTCAFAFGICGDMAQRTLIPACSQNLGIFENSGASNCALGKTSSKTSYLNAIKGPFYYYLTKSWSSVILASTSPSIALNKATNNHSVSNFYGIEIQKNLLKFITEYPTLYNDLPSNINNKYDYINQLIDKLTKYTDYDPEWRPDPTLAMGGIDDEPNQVSIIEIGVNIRTNIVLSGYYSVPSGANGDVRSSITLTVDKANLEATAIVDPNTIVPSEEMPQEDEYGDIPGQPSRPWGSKGGKYKTVVKRTSKKLRKRRSKRTTKKLRR